VQKHLEQQQSQGLLVVVVLVRAGERRVVLLGQQVAMQGSAPLGASSRLKVAVVEGHQVVGARASRPHLLVWPLEGLWGSRLQW
jgi:hypothetical protein